MKSKIYYVEYPKGFKFSEPSALRDLAGIAESENPGWVAMVPRTYDRLRHRKREGDYAIELTQWEASEQNN